MLTFNADGRIEIMAKCSMLAVVQFLILMESSIYPAAIYVFNTKPVAQLLPGITIWISASISLSRRSKLIS